jgi:hypothetical protein
VPSGSNVDVDELHRQQQVDRNVFVLSSLVTCEEATRRRLRRPRDNVLPKSLSIEVLYPYDARALIRIWT